jgi:hypothetical protein
MEDATARLVSRNVLSNSCDVLLPIPWSLSSARGKIEKECLTRCSIATELEVPVAWFRHLGQLCCCNAPYLAQVHALGSSDQSHIILRGNTT